MVQILLLKAGIMDLRICKNARCKTSGPGWSWTTNCIWTILSDDSKEPWRLTSAEVGDIALWGGKTLVLALWDLKRIWKRPKKGQQLSLCQQIIWAVPSRSFLMSLLMKVNPDGLISKKQKIYVGLNMSVATERLRNTLVHIKAK